jgi:hypothetical protein
MAQNKKAATGNPVLRWSVVAAIAVVALFGSYGFAQAHGAAAQAATLTAPAPGSGAVAASSSGSGCCGAGGVSSATGIGSGGSCCGGARSGPAVTGQAVVSGGVQKIAVDVSKGYFDPDTIELKAGVPARITFGQGSGCLSQVQSQQLGFSQDLTRGPVTIELPALAAGTYTFTCGMRMQSGTIVVK